MEEKTKSIGTKRNARYANSDSDSTDSDSNSSQPSDSCACVYNDSYHADVRYEPCLLPATKVLTCVATGRFQLRIRL